MLLINPNINIVKGMAHLPRPPMPESFSLVNEKAEWKDGMPPGSVIYMSQKSAYVTSDILYLWLKDHFVPKKIRRNYRTNTGRIGSHCNSVEILEYADANNKILSFLPSHTIYYIPPLVAISS
ncbi:hypothetical protein QE152_g3962 [Popillia japonica]|uniref:Uncharacterized protein n=1 Tax=Popillia japonica TaxID=7064 RepID=A0AAW1N0T5_POPJA